MLVNLASVDVRNSVYCQYEKSIGVNSSQCSAPVVAPTAPVVSPPAPAPVPTKTTKVPAGTTSIA